ncbi:MAG TPA: hypothetical protein VJ739_18755, partial [Gemmataceae bacterium]|nr:hypothetical protein [Gemmataceae bacterium]
MPPAALRAILRRAHELCPRLEVVCLETRFKTVRAEAVLAWQRRFREWHRACGPGGCGTRLAAAPAVLQISAGYETQDPYLRNAVLWKGYPENRVQQFFAAVGRLQQQSGAPVTLDEYVMLKPAAGLTDEEGVAEAVETVVHLERLGACFGVAVSVRLNPTFAAAGSELFYQFRQGGYRPPTLREVYRVLEGCHERGVCLPVFVGLHDEGLAYAD